MTSKQDILLAHENDITDQEYVYTKFAKKFWPKCLITVLNQPVTFARTLWQVGYEPCSVILGKPLWIIGRECYYLPNIIIYLRWQTRKIGLSGIYTGVCACFISNLIGGFTQFVGAMLLPLEIGGDPINLNKAEEDLNDCESLQVKVRQAIRDTICVTASVIISRPFTTIMVRQIVQTINQGQKNLYSNMFQSFFRIIREEGPAGLFSGLLPQLIGEWILVWSAATLTYGFNRFRRYFFFEKQTDKVNEKAERDALGVLQFFIPLVTNTFAYPFCVASTIMAVSGSECTSSLMYSPTFIHWSDAYDYLRAANGLDRGQKLFWRRYKGIL